MKARNANCPPDLSRYTQDCVATISIAVILFSHDLRKSTADIENVRTYIFLTFRNKTYKMYNMIIYNKGKFTFTK
jgi:hypothetical protein